MVKIGRYKVDLIYIGLIFFMFCTIINTSQFGASLSWVLFPCLIILIGTIGAERYVNKNACLILVFYFFCFISTIFSKYVSLQRDMITFAFFCLIYILVVSHKYSIVQIKRLNIIYIFIAFYTSLNILYNWLTHNYYIEWFKRASFSFLGVYKDPNYAMAFIVPAMVLFLYKIIYCNKRMIKIFFIFLEIIMITNFITTGSRGPLITFLFAILLFFLIKSNYPTKKKIQLVIIFVLLIFIGLNIITKILPTQSINRLFHSTSDSRTNLWESALLVFYKNPLFGGGLGAASEVSLALAGNYSHNVYLDILANSGILGFSSFMIFFSINCLRTKRRNAYFIITMSVAFMLPLFFINGFNTATFYFPLIYMSILSRLCVDKEFKVESLLV